MTRIRALVVVGILSIAAIVLVVVTVNRDSQGGDTTAQNCQPGNIPVSLELPESGSEITINVFNATQTTGLANNVAADFRNRKFNVEKVESEMENGQEKYYPDEVAVLRYGPKTVAAAHLLRAYFLNETTPQFDLKREDNIVDVVVGGRFKQLATPTEVNQAVAILGRPKLPPGTCEG
ncbi:MAG TPA: LytR C-terminal domain-containing protein [Candidatus Limnocylindrales bacterium]